MIFFFFLKKNVIIQNSRVLPECPPQLKCFISTAFHHNVFFYFIATINVYILCVDCNAGEVISIISVISFLPYSNTELNEVKHRMTQTTLRTQISGILNAKCVFLESFPIFFFLFSFYECSFFRAACSMRRATLYGRNPAKWQMYCCFHLTDSPLKMLRCFCPLHGHSLQSTYLSFKRVFLVQLEKSTQQRTGRGTKKNNN